MMDIIYKLFEQEDILALNIGTDAITGLLVKRMAGEFQIVKAFNKTLDGEPATALADILESEKISPCLVHMSFSSDHPFLRFMGVPAAGENEIRQILSVRMDAEMPVPLSQLYWDYWLVGGEEKREAAVVACERSKVHKYYDVLTKRGFRPQLVTFDAPLLRDLVIKKVPTSEKSFMVLSQQGNRLIFLVFEDGSLKYFRTINLGNMESDESGIIERYFSETIEYYRNYRELEIPAKIYFIDDELDQAIQTKIVENFELQSETIDFLVEDYSVSDHVKKSDGWPKRFLLCLGILEGIRKKESNVINLLPGELRRKGIREQIIEKAFTYKVLGIACAVLFLFSSCCGKG